MQTDTKKEILERIINEKLKPIIRKVDEEAYFPKEFLHEVGHSSFFTSSNLEKEQVFFREIFLIEETAKYCMTSAFLLWCHLATLASVRLSNNHYIKDKFLPLLESGEELGGTGLSNAFKYYAGLEKIHLKAERTAGGYHISGCLPSISNLGDNHRLVILASVNTEQRIICLLPIKIKGLELKSRTDFVGLNGSATYSCFFHHVFVPDKWIITEEADEFIEKVRPTLALYQIALGIGVSDASIKMIQEIHAKNLEGNQHLKPQPMELINEVQYIRKRTYEYAQHNEIEDIGWKILSTRLEIAKLTLKIVQTEMLYFGSHAYLAGNDSFRRLREAYFIVNLTPTIKQLEIFCAQ